MPLKLIPPRAGKSPFWSVRGTHLGIYVDKTTKLTVRAKAQAVLARWRDEIERGQFAVKGDPDFVTAAVAYVEAGGERRFVKPLADYFKDRALRSINQAEIDKAAIALYPNATPATRNRQVYTVMSAILKRAGVKGNLKRPVGSGGQAKVNWIWPEDAFAIFDRADAADPEFGLLLRVLCYTGMRLGEALSLTVEDVRLQEAFAFLPTTKNKMPRSVYLPPIVVEALQAHPRGMARTGRVFKFAKSGWLYKRLNKALVDAGFDPETADITFHTFRHTWATWMRRYGGLDTRGLVGTGAWQDAKSAARYEHVVVSEEAMKAALLPVKKAGNDIEKPEKTS